MTRKIELAFDRRQSRLLVAYRRFRRINSDRDVKRRILVDSHQKGMGVAREGTWDLAQKPVGHLFDCHLTLNRVTVAAQDVTSLGLLVLAQAQKTRHLSKQQV
jgi:hypothetical protein